MIIGTLIVLYFIYAVFFQLSKISKNYGMLIYQFHLISFEGKGHLVKENQNNDKLFCKGTGEIIDFKLESNGDLTIIWSYRYFQQEVEYVHKVIKKTFNKNNKTQTLAIVANCENEARIIFKNHKNNIDNNGISTKYLNAGITNEGLIISRDFLDGI